MPFERLARFVLLPELELKGQYKGGGGTVFEAIKERPKHEICPRCATPATSYYDRRQVTVKDEPIRDTQVRLIIHKHRWWCKLCKKPFTEPVEGILPRRKTTQRFRKAILEACENYTDLSRVRHSFCCSSALVYQIFYEQLQLKWREYQYDWPKKIGIDEHFFRRYRGRTEFSTILTDLSNSRVKELCLGKQVDGLLNQLANHSGRHGVELVAMDLSHGYRKFVWNYFPNAKIVADKFHVIRLLSPEIFKELKKITGKNVKRVTKRKLLTPSWNLGYFEKMALWEKLKQFPKLNELYWWKEHLHKLYRTKGYDRALTALEVTVQQMKQSSLKEIKRLAKTLESWKEEITNYFRYRITNATTEGYNNIAKLVQKRAFGYKSHRNYRLRVLNACA